MLLNSMPVCSVNRICGRIPESSNHPIFRFSVSLVNKLSLRTTVIRSICPRHSMGSVSHPVWECLISTARNTTVLNSTLYTARRCMTIDYSRYDWIAPISFCSFDKTNPRSFYTLSTPIRVVSWNRTGLPFFAK